MIGDAEINEVVATLRSGWIGSGFERLLQDYVGVSNVRCVSSCTAALILGLRALDVGPGDDLCLQ